MKEKIYILFLEKDLTTSSFYMLAIQKCQPDSKIYYVSTTCDALKLLDSINDDHRSWHHRQEIFLIVDLNMNNLEGYQLVTSLESHPCICPIRVSVINDETWINMDRPILKHYQFENRFCKDMSMELFESILKRSSPIYFMKNGIVELDFRYK